MATVTTKPPQRLRMAYLLGLAALGALGSVHGAESKGKAPACVYGEQPMEALAQAPKRSRLVVTGSAPQAGEPVHPGTVLGIDVEFHVQDFVASRPAPEAATK